MRYHQVTAEKGQYSEPEFPIMDGYKMACCDCGLVHDMQFFVAEVIRFNKDGSFKIKERKGKKWRIGLRAKRNNRSTAQMRRHGDYGNEKVKG